VNYVLSQNTANELKKLIDAKPGSSTGHNNQAGQRQVGYVLITSEREGYEGQFWATVQAYDVVLSNWRSFDPCLVLKANDDDIISVGKRYQAIRFGKGYVEGEIQSIWVAGFAFPDLACGLWFNDDDQLAIYTQDIAGQGLNYDDTYCQLYIDPGCGITLEGGKKVGVHAGALAGEGLIARTGCELDVAYGDCLTIEDDLLNVDLTESYGPSFSAITSVSLSGSGCGITLNWTVTPFNFKVNPCGLFLGFEPGTPVSNSSYVPIGCCCDPIDYEAICYYCEYPPIPDPDPDPDPDPELCEGQCDWEYQEGTGWVLTSSTCPEGCTCPEPIDDGLPQSIATTACVQANPDPEPGSCPTPETLYAIVTPEGCSGVSFTLNNDGPGSWTGSSPMGSCACPGMPIEYWDLSLTCNEGAWNIGLAAPTGSTILSAVTIDSTSPLQLSISGTMTCEGAYGQQTFTITITITE
jgi:hypothetical protein